MISFLNENYIKLKKEQNRFLFNIFYYVVYQKTIIDFILMSLCMHFF